MKRLILVRHGKSSWEHDVIDHERPLKERGFSDGNLVSTAYKEAHENPEVIWTSDAKRALTTAVIFKETLKMSDDKFFENHKFYTFDGRDLKHIIKGCEDHINSLMVFGHNHAMTDVANALGDKAIDNVPTTGLTIIDFDVERWTQIKHGKTIATIFPKDLK